MTMPAAYRPGGAVDVDKTPWNRETLFRFQVPIEQIEFPMAVTVCAWCKPREAARSLVVTHGICPRHLRKLEHDMHKPPRRRARKGQTPAGGQLFST